VLTCREAIDRLSELESRDLTPAERRETKRHLVGCEDCLPYWRSYRTTVALERAAYSKEDPADLEIPEALVREVLASARTVPAFLASTGYVVHIFWGIAAAPLLTFWLR